MAIDLRYRLVRESATEVEYAVMLDDSTPDAPDRTLVFDRADPDRIIRGDLRDPLTAKGAGLVLRDRQRTGTWPRFGAKQS